MGEKTERLKEPRQRHPPAHLKAVIPSSTRTKPPKRGSGCQPGLTVQRRDDVFRASGTFHALAQVFPPAQQRRVAAPFGAGGSGRLHAGERLRGRADLDRVFGGSAAESLNTNESEIRKTTWLQLTS